jgi:hypothetical protein
MKAIAVCWALLLVIASAPSARAGSNAGAFFRYWDFSDGRPLRDYIVFIDPGPLHLQFEYWDFATGEDRVRPEVALRLRDRRRSSYELGWRHEGEVERLTLATGQVVGHAVVVRAAVSPLVSDDGTQVVLEAGADRYWSDYSHAGATVIRDPREGGLWAVPIRARFATSSNDWLQGTLAPASRRTLGWAVDAKWRWLRAGIERNNRFDFTDLDNTIYTLGIQRGW